jgi:hypothetical protein
MRSNSWDNKENTSLSSSRGCAAPPDGSQTLHRKPKSAVSRSKRMRNRSLEMVLDDPTATDSSATKRYHIRTKKEVEGGRRIIFKKILLLGLFISDGAFFCAAFKRGVEIA